MQKKDKQRLKSQLEQEAARLIDMSGRDLMVSLLASCNALLTMTERLYTENDDTGIADDIYANYLGIAGKVNRFYERHGKKEDDSGSLADANVKLNTILDEIESGKKRRESLQKQYEEAVIENNVLQETAEKLEKELRKQNELKERLEEWCADYSPEIIEKKKNENERLLDDLNRKRQELSVLVTEHEAGIKEKEDAARKIAEIRKAIDDVPEELVKLRDEYKSLDLEYSELQKAEDEYSPEKQKALQEKIDVLAPAVEENRTASEVLANRLEYLKQQDTKYDEERHVVSSNLTGLILQSMNDLKRYLSESKEFLDEVERQAKTLEENLAKCEERLKKNKERYGATKTPLEAMIAHLEIRGYDYLRNTLDVGSLPEIRKKFEIIDKNLEDLEKITQRCREATQEDYRNAIHNSGLTKPL